MSSSSSAHGSLRGYVAGFILSVVLTLASFAAVMSNVIPSSSRLALIVVLCVAQLLVQLVFFLHLGSARSQRANTAIFACTGFLIAVVVAGSLWVMHNANVNMMPMPMSVRQALTHE